MSKKLTALFALGAEPATGDQIYMVDVSDTSQDPAGSSKRVSFSNLVTGQVSNTLYDANTILKADTDNTPAALSVTSSTFVGRKSSGSIAAMSVSESKTELGAGSANGLATLDGGGKVPSSQLPSSVMDFKGNWNASTNTPTLADGTGSAGDVFVVSVAGSQNLGSGSITFAAGDWVVYNGTIWEKSINSNAVASVFSRTGAVTASNGDYTASNITNAASGSISSVTVQTAIDELDSEKQPKDTGLTSISGLTTVANNMIYTTASDVYAVTTLSAFGRTLIDDATAGDARTTLGLGSADSPSFSNLTLGGGTVTLSVDTNFVTSGGVNGFSVDGTTFSVDGSGNNVGFGTAAPQSAVHVQGTRNNTNPAFGIHLGMNATDAAIEIVANSTIGSSFIDFSDGGVDFAGRLIYSHSTNLFAFAVGASGTPRITIGTGFQVGSPTGGDKGDGTANFAGDIFKNNSAYTNPDYVLEMWHTGKIEKFKDNEGAKDYKLPSIEEIEKTMRETYRLPRMSDAAMGSFARQDWMLEKMEEAFICIIDLKKEIQLLQAA